jgi:hypothetical protein
MPEKYRVIFYTEERKGSIWNVDYTNWVNIPPPDFSISASPNSITAIPGENKIVDVQINSTTGLTPTIEIHPQNIAGIESRPIINKSVMPSFGVITMPIQIIVRYEATQGNNLIPIKAIATYPYESAVATTATSRNEHLSVLDVNKNQTLTKESTLTIKVNPPFDQNPTINEVLIKALQVLNTLSPHVITVSTLIAIFTTAGTGIYGIAKWARKNNKDDPENKSKKEYHEY